MGACGQTIAENVWKRELFSVSLSLGNVVGSGGASIGGFLFGAIVTGLSGLLTIIAFTFVAVQLMVTLIESYVVIGGGMLMLGFLGSRWTLPFGEKYFGYAVSTGIKLFTLYLIVGEGQNVANQIIHILTAGGATPGPVDFMGAGASSLAYGAMGYMVPAMAGSMMNGSPSLSMGNMASAGGGMLGSMVGAGAMAASTALRGFSAATDAFSKTTKAAGNIGGEAASHAGGIGGTLAGAANVGSGKGTTSGFGDGISSRVDAPLGLATTTSGRAGAAAQAQPTPAPAAAEAGKAQPGNDMSASGAASGTAALDGSGQTTSTTPAPAPESKQSQQASAPGVNDGSGQPAQLKARFDQAAQAQSTATAGRQNKTGANAQSVSQSTSAQQPHQAAAATPAQKQVSKGNGATATTDPDTTSFAKNLSTSQEVKAAGGTDAIVDKNKTSIDLKKKADSLEDMARRMDRLPVNDGHTGGISIRLNHLE